jgi:hypothetical protein
MAYAAGAALSVTGPSATGRAAEKEGVSRPASSNAAASANQSSVRLRFIFSRSVHMASPPSTPEYFPDIGDVVL